MPNTPKPNQHNESSKTLPKRHRHAVDIHPIPYLANSECYYSAIRHLANPVWLDSGRPHAEFGRYDILSAAPTTLLSTKNGSTSISENPIENLLSDRFCSLSGEMRSQQSTENPFELLYKALKQLGDCDKNDVNHENQPNLNLPFTGGAIGYFGYHLGELLETNLPNKVSDVNIPDMLFGIYDWAIIQDHQLQQSYVVTRLQNKTPSRTETAIKNEILDLIENVHSCQNDISKTSKNNFEADTNPNNKSFKINKIENNIDVNYYHNAIEKIQRYIEAGDCYQVNFAQRFETTYQGDSFTAYQHLRQQLPAPFGGFMEFEQGSILCHSPERFLKVDQQEVETLPIKGTISRGKDEVTDKKNAETLLDSEKDRAENLMIVDLLRNDLSKNCTFGSVKTPELFKLESYANVHHLVSKVTGTLSSESSPLDLLSGCFPGGSITGAPKIRAMEIIDELEPVERSVYCGSLGYISTNGIMDTNITIRTIALDKEKLYCWGGGGIVADSKAEKEYQESIQKVKILLDGLNKFTE